MSDSNKVPLPNIGAPARRALEGAAVYSLNDLVDHTEREIAGLHGMGPKGIRILKTALAEHGLEFAPESTRS